MLPNTTENIWKAMQVTGHATYIPSALLLLMAVDNGWNIVESQIVASQCEDEAPTYHITLESRSDGQQQKLAIPKSALVEKIIEQNMPETLFQQ